MGNLLRRNKDFALVLAMVLILLVLFAPIPSMVLDLAIIINFGLGLTILLLTFYVAKPVDFSTFPSLLLISTLFRLSLNVAATRLILTGGEAGQVIGSIGTFSVGGNFIVGLVVFSILIVVQFVVVTSGAQRVSEVAARFTLDSMPGQQMSIDADLNMGLIDQKEALARREALEKQAQFYGSMDGASKFVKGDAIAGIIIILIDIIAGWAIGVAQMGMAWSQALQHFTLLTIGDGIATQLPALIIAIATGILVTRSSADKELSSEVFRQLFSVPRVPIIVGGILLLMLLLPGMPKWPIAGLLAAAVIVWFTMRGTIEAEFVMDSEAPEEEPKLLTAPSPFLQIALGKELGAAWKEKETILMDRISSLRDEHERQNGIGFPAMSLIDGPRLAPLEYEIRLHGTAYASGEIHPDLTLAIRGNENKTPLSGINTVDPAFGLPATWIDPAQDGIGENKDHTFVDPITVLITHLGEVLRLEASTLLSRQTVNQLLDEVRERQPGLVEDVVPNLLNVSDVQKVLQNLMSESVPLTNIDRIIEYLADFGREVKDPGQLTEQVRQKMSYEICNKLRERHKQLSVLSLDPRIENQLMSSMNAAGSQGSLPVDPRLAEQLIRELSNKAQAMTADGRSPVILCSAELRRPLQSLIQRSVPKLSVISVAEIPRNIDLQSYDIVKLEQNATL